MRQKKCLLKIFWVKHFFWQRKIFQSKIFWVKKFFWGTKKFLGRKFIFVKNYFGVKKFFGSKKICIRNYYISPPPKNSRVKIVLGCCWYCWLRLHIKFQTPRTILSCRSRVPGGWGVLSDNHVKSNPMLRLG